VYNGIMARLKLPPNFSGRRSALSGRDRSASSRMLANSLICKRRFRNPGADQRYLGNANGQSESIFRDLTPVAGANLAALSSSNPLVSPSSIRRHPGNSDGLLETPEGPKSSLFFSIFLYF